MALRADFNVQFVTIGGACCEGVTATARDLDLFVFRVNFGFHSKDTLALNPVFKQGPGV